MSIGMINADDLIAYCEKCADTCRELHTKVLNNIGHGESEQSAIGACAYFMKQEQMYRWEIPNIIRGFENEQKQALADNVGCGSDTEQSSDML